MSSDFFLSKTLWTILCDMLAAETRGIQITVERWYSSDLQITLMSTTSDPRIGTTTYQVTSLQRGEPSPSLFEVPAEYTTVKENGNVMMRVERRGSTKE